MCDHEVAGDVPEAIEVGHSFCLYAATDVAHEPIGEHEAVDDDP